MPRLVGVPGGKESPYHNSLCHNTVQDRHYYVYIMSSRGKVLYVGVTSNLISRVYQHKHKLINGFTKRYNITKLIYYEDTNDVWEALCREKKIKGWLRRKKIVLIESKNPEWKDLAEDWDFSALSS